MRSREQNELLRPRYLRACAEMPPPADLWRALLVETDVVAHQSTSQGVGGPFGAQLWLQNISENRLIPIGHAGGYTFTNTVLKTGLACAHAEAECLNAESREKIIGFLAALDASQRMKWKIIHLSSAESCPSCRSRQLLFARELIAMNFIHPGAFHIGFDATFHQTARNTKFVDDKYDGVFRQLKGRSLHDEASYKIASRLIGQSSTNRPDNGDSAFLSAMTASELQAERREIFVKHAHTPCCVAVRPDCATPVIVSVDNGDRFNNATHRFENSVFPHAFRQAAHYLRNSQGVFESWDLSSFRTYTNVSDIGPLSFAEALWYSIGKIRVVSDFCSPEINRKAREDRNLSNKAFFDLVADEYNEPGSALAVTHLGDAKTPSAAHLNWQSQLALEAKLKSQYVMREKIKHLRFQDIQGDELPVKDILSVRSKNISYNGL